MSAISKSISRSMGCEVHYVNYYLSDDPAPRLIESPIARVGQDFHRYRAAYVNHLRDKQLAQEPDWVEVWLADAGVTVAARDLIKDDARFFRVNPETVLATELFLAVDREFRPLERKQSSTPGLVSARPDAVLSGTIDQLDLDGDVAYVNDCKSGWSTSSVTDNEPAFYAALVFAHFPGVNRVEFSWEFVRVHLGKATSYTRDDLEWIHKLILGEHAKRADIERRYRAGENLALNPFAGLCTFCAIRCPLRQAVEMGNVSIPPVQTESDARTVAALHYAAGELYERTREALLPWADEHGPMDLGGGFVLQVETKGAKSLPLPQVLDVIGYDASQLGDKSPKYRIPIDKLTIGNISNYAKAKMRAGLAEELESIALVSPRTYLSVRRVALESFAPDAPDQLTEGGLGL